MANVNKVILIGNITRDIELRYTPQGTAVTDIGLAVNKIGKDDNGNKTEEVTFIDITLWDRNAENVSKYLGKGSPLYVEGELKLDQWDDKESGQKRSKLKVVGKMIQFLGGRKDGDQSQQSPPQQSQRREAPRNQSVPSNRQQDNPPNDDDDIPF